MGDLSKPRKYEESHQRDHHTPLLDNTNEIENSERKFLLFVNLKDFLIHFTFIILLKYIYSSFFRIKDVKFL